jgi:hypothetical protein
MTAGDLMNRFHTLLLATSVSAGLLLSSIASAVTLGAYEQARSDWPSQSQILKQAYEAALSETLFRLRSTSFKDGKAKVQTRIERDKTRADRIEYIVSHFTEQQSKALAKLIDDYSQAQPNTELEAVIVSFLLTEANKPADPASGNASYQSFMTEMDKLSRSRAIDAAQAELDRQAAQLECRRRNLDYQILDDGTRVHRDQDGTWRIMPPGAAIPECATP